MAITGLSETTENFAVQGWLLAVIALWVAVLIGLSAAAGRTYHPATLVARPGAFATPANPGIILGAAGHTVLGTMMVGGLISDIGRRDEVGFVVGIGLLWLGLAGAFWTAALGRFGVRLTAAGIVDRQVLGSLFVPWEALASPVPAYPYDPLRVTLFLTRPELVKRRGLRQGARTIVPAAAVDAELLARAVHEYANRPDLRPAIGAESELARFLAIPQIEALAARP